MLVDGSGGYGNGGGDGNGVVMLKILVIGGDGDGHRGGDVESGDYKLQAASLTNDLTNASKTKPSQNLSKPSCSILPGASWKGSWCLLGPRWPQVLPQTPPKIDFY